MGSVKEQNFDHCLKETSPRIGAGAEANCSCDLVELMEYVFVHVVKAINIYAAEDAKAGGCNLYAQVILEPWKVITKHAEKQANPAWDEVFAFSKDHVRGSKEVEVLIKHKANVVVDSAASGDDILGKITFDLSQVQKYLHANYLAPQWYKLVSSRDEEVGAKGELLLAVWVGTQADKLFYRAWHSDSMVTACKYVLPRLSYVRVNVNEAHGYTPSEETCSMKAQVLAVLGNQTFRTRISKRGTRGTEWNEDLLFLAAEPFQDKLAFMVERLWESGRREIVGSCMVPLQKADRRLDQRPREQHMLYKLSGTDVSVEQPERQNTDLSSIWLSICQEGGYHVLTEPTDYCSDFRAAAESLCRPRVGILELGIVGANGLPPTKTEEGGLLGRPDAYCVAKYGMKWVRTRIITDNCNPRWNEQYSWEVFDLSTIITVCVFNDNRFHGYGEAIDFRMGKVRIRISSLRAGEVCRHRYPLLVLQASGMKKMGEIDLVVRFTSSSAIKALLLYSQPLWPVMHFKHPVSRTRLDSLTDVATEMISRRFGMADHP